MAHFMVTETHEKWKILSVVATIFLFSAACGSSNPQIVPPTTPKRQTPKPTTVKTQSPEQKAPATLSIGPAIRLFPNGALSVSDRIVGRIDADGNFVDRGGQVLIRTLADGRVLVGGDHEVSVQIRSDGVMVQADGIEVRLTDSGDVVKDGQVLVKVLGYRPGLAGTVFRAMIYSGVANAMLGVAGSADDLRLFVASVLSAIVRECPDTPNTCKWATDYVHPPSATAVRPAMQKLSQSVIERLFKANEITTEPIQSPPGVDGACYRFSWNAQQLDACHGADGVKIIGLTAP